MRKTIQFYPLILLIYLACLSNTQTVDKHINNHIKARGLDISFDNVNLINKTHQIIGYDFLTTEQYHHQIVESGHYGLFRDVETLLFGFLCGGKLFYDHYTPTSVIGQAIKTSSTNKLSNIPYTPNLFNGFIWQNYWEITGLGYATYQYVAPHNVSGHYIQHGQELFYNWTSGIIPLSIFAKRFDFEVQRQLRDPLYGQLSKLMWSETVLRALVYRNSPSPFQPGMIMRFCQRYYYPLIHTLSFSLQITSWISSWIENYLNPLLLANNNTLPSIENPSTLPYYSYLRSLNPRVIEPHLDYWIGLLFVPGNVILYWIALFTRSERIRKMHMYWVFGSFICFAINGLPVTIDRLKLFASIHILPLLEDSIIQDIATQLLYLPVHVSHYLAKSIADNMTNVHNEL